MHEVVLEVRGATKSFGGIKALTDVSLRILGGQIYGLIGPNGAGKTTFFNVITGIYPPSSGTFLLGEEVYEPRAIHKVARRGIARTFQNIRLFSRMTALENVMVGRYVRTGSGVWGALTHKKSFRQEEHNIYEKSMELLSYVGLKKVANWSASTLSYGDQRRLEIARALATEPKLLALDEPAAGMNSTEKLQLRNLIENIRSDGHTVLIIEHDVKLVMGLCDEVTVLDYGKVIAQGPPSAVQKDPKVIEAYLGTSAMAVTTS